MKIDVKYKHNPIWDSRDIPFIDKDELKHLRKAVRKSLYLSKKKFKAVIFQDLSLHDVTYLYKNACYKIGITSKEYYQISKWHDALLTNNNARRELQKLTKYEIKAKQ